MAKKKPEPTFYRMTISIAMDLKRRMDKVTDPVNWSAEAARAFEAKLAEFAARRELKSMDDIVQRLRASKIEMEGQDYQAGYEAGKEWAGKHADARHLANLDQFQDQAGHEWEDCFVTGDRDAFTAGDRLAENITGDHSMDRGDRLQFWERALGDDAEKIHNDDFARGFAEGAIALWVEVKSQL